MESLSENSWNLPEDPYERQARVREIADDLCRQYDEISFRYMNKILEKVRADMGRLAIEDTL